MADRALLRSMMGGEDLSPEMQLLLVLVIFDGYELFPMKHDSEKEFSYYQRGGWRILRSHCSGL
jgi:hypothetical protein